ncbi:MAG: hypothetical protein ACLT4C_03975 [Butyricicoccus sp.]
MLSVPLLFVLPTIVLTGYPTFAIVSVYSTLLSAEPFFSAVFVVRVSAVPNPA